MPLVTFNLKMNKKTNNTIITKTLTISQLGLIAIIFALGPAIAYGSYTLIAIQLVGLILGIAALLTVGVRNFSAFPAPREGIKLVTTGPFRFIRHPMYLAVLLVTAPISINAPTTSKVLLLVLLVIILIVKIKVEERLLTTRFSEYNRYQQTSWSLIPFVI